MAWTVGGDVESYWNFRDMPSVSSSRREQRGMVLSSMKGLVCRAGFPAPDNVLDVLRLGEHRLSDHLVLMKLCWVLTKEPPEAKS